MNRYKGTNGNWVVKDHFDVVQEEDKDYIIASCKISYDAKLIAQAPKMRDAIVTYLKRIKEREEIDSMRSYAEFVNIIEEIDGEKIEDILE